MRRGNRTFCGQCAGTTGLAIAAIALLLAPGDAMSGAYEAGAPASAGARWSNERHFRNGIVSAPGCVALPPGQGADYVPGRNARGGPVPPADSHTGYYTAPPVGLEIELGRKRIGGRRLQLDTGPMLYDPSRGTLNGHSLLRDCAPRFK